MARAYGVNGRVGPAFRFTWNEVRCTDGSLPLDRRMRRRYVVQARNLNRLRKRIAKHYGVKFSAVSISVNSWYRSPEYNRQIGGASRSEHVEGRATDVTVHVSGIGKLAPHVVAQLAEAVSAFERGGIGWYDRDHGAFTHLDHRPNGPARWVN